VLAAIDQFGLAHMKTMGEYQVLMITYRSSKLYLDSVSSDSTASLIAQLKAVTEEIAKDTGVDGWPTKITLSVFTQIRDNLNQLKQQPISATLQSAIVALDADFGNVMALAYEGDRPKTFEAATALYRKIQDLYPLIESVSGANPAFELGLTIRGLAEFYAEFAQVNS
jgi:hypothetical protein